jgi:hypothetical protein
MIMDTQFPGATTLGDAFQISPALYINFFIENAIDTLKGLTILFRHWFNPDTDDFRRYAGLTLFIGGMFLSRAVGLSWWTKRTGTRHQNMADVFAACIFIGPPLLSCIMVYPRVHYLILVMYFLFVGIAYVVRRFSNSEVSLTATLVLGASIVIATPVLPRVEQPVVQTIAMFRVIPGIKTLFEADLGWCTYYQPPCRAIWPDAWRGGFSFSDRVNKDRPDAIMMSNALGAIAGVDKDPLYQQLRSDPRSVGYEATALPQGRTLLLKR